MLKENLIGNNGFRTLNASELSAISGGNLHIDGAGVDPLNPHHSRDDILNQVLMTGSMSMNEYGGFVFVDADFDGVHDSYDHMNGANDEAPHIHGTDGTTMGQNEDGTWTLYDANGNATQGAWTMTGIGVDTGSSGGANASNTGGGFNYSGDGNNYTFVPAG